jgi:hypothetical protein
LKRTGQPKYTNPGRRRPKRKERKKGRKEEGSKLHMKEQHIDLAEQRLKGPLTEKALDRLDEALDTEKGEKLANVCFKILHHAGIKNAEREQTPLLARQEGAQIAAASITGLLQGMKQMFGEGSQEQPTSRAQHTHDTSSQEHDSPQFRITSEIPVVANEEEGASPEEEYSSLGFTPSQLEQLYGDEDE